MQYGYFDDKAKEYVITRPDTPRSWSNYSGDRLYGAIYTNNAGGYAFHRSSAEGRLLRFNYNSVPMDQPGRYFYLRDRDSGDFWSASWQPVAKPLDAYESTCRMGSAYMVIDSRYDGIAMESAYFVPLGQRFEYWRLKITNEGDTPRKLSVFPYCEFTCEWHIMNDYLNQQYSAYIIQCEWEDGMLSGHMCRNLPEDKKNFKNRNQHRPWWMGAAGSADVAAYDLDRTAFIGPYGSYAAPRAVVDGACGHSTVYGDNACGGMQMDIDLAPGETKSLMVLLGVGHASSDGRETMNAFAHDEAFEREFVKLKQHWHERMDVLQVETPDDDFNHMVNVWNIYNALMTFTWSRSCSLVYTGDNRDGFGYRDTVQDIVGIVHTIPDLARERLELMISGQESNGGARPEVNPLNHRPGEMEKTDDRRYRCDDALWLFNSVPAYVAETGDVEFYDNVVPYADRGEDTVFMHLEKALQFNLDRRGKHGLPCGLAADWNDCLVLGFHGESVFVTFQLRLGLDRFMDIARLLGKDEEAAWAEEHLAELDAAIQKHAWDGQWFLRAHRENGGTLGSAKDEEGKVFLNPQSWSVLSGAASAEQAASAMDAVERELETEYGLMICTPPFRKADFQDVRAMLLNPGTKENGGIFSHTQGWAVMADCILGQGDRAFRHYKAYMPAAQNDRAEVRQIEPYVHCQSTHSKHSPQFGASRCPWLSGAVTWSYFAATQYILGLQPDIDGFRIDPCIPAAWDGFTAARQYRGQRLNIAVSNPDHVEKGVKHVTVNGANIQGNLIPMELLTEGADIQVILGAA